MLISNLALFFPNSPSPPSNLNPISNQCASASTAPTPPATTQQPAPPACPPTSATAPQPSKPQPPHSEPRRAQVPETPISITLLLYFYTNANAMFATGAVLEDRNETVTRPYCDACIKSGVELFIDRGLDPDVYARGMGVILNALIREYPGWLD